MKKITAIIITLAVYPVISSAEEIAVGRAYVMSGNVTIASQGGKKAKKAKQVNVSEPIVAGSLIKTGEGSAALLKFEDGQMVTMQSSSAFQVNEYRYDPERIENSKVDFALQEGGVRVVPGQIGHNKRLAFSLVTRNATFRGGAAEFAVVKAGNVVHGRVLSGEVRVTNSAGTASFKTGQSPVVPSSLRLASAFYPTESSDLFDEIFSIPVEPPVVVEPVPAPAEALAPAPAAAAPEPAPFLVPAPVLPAPEQLTGVTAEGPDPEQLTGVTAEESVPEAIPEPVPAPSPEPAPADAPESVTAELPETVSEPPLQPVEAPAPESASVSASVSLPVQEAPSCTCNCTFSCK